MEFFGIGNSTYYFLKIDSIYMSIIITIVSNITLLVLYNIIYFGYFMTMSHTINKNTSPSASLHLPFHYEVFTRFACCLLLYQPSTALIGFYFCFVYIPAIIKVQINLSFAWLLIRPLITNYGFHLRSNQCNFYDDFILAWIFLPIALQ